MKRLKLTHAQRRALAIAEAPSWRDGPKGRAGNRHDRKRWLRALDPLLAVASDALEQDNRPAAITVLCEMLPLEESVSLTGEPKGPEWDIIDEAQTFSIEGLRALSDRIIGLGGQPSQLYVNPQTYERLTAVQIAETGIISGVAMRLIADENVPRDRAFVFTDHHGTDLYWRGANGTRVRITDSAALNTTTAEGTE